MSKLSNINPPWIHLQEQIAIDGPAASGKSTVARMLANQLGIYYINTGSMYRLLTWKIMEAGISFLDESQIALFLQSVDMEYKLCDHQLVLYWNQVEVPEERLRSPEITRAVSEVAQLSTVRSWMLEKQRSCAKLGFIVMEGRDIGTVVFPQARWKFFITATPWERARRRLAQKGEVWDQATLESVAQEITQRDAIDSSRSIAPLKPAADAVLVDTTSLSIEEVVNQLYQSVMKELPSLLS